MDKTELDWVAAEEHLETAITVYESIGWVGQFALQTNIYPLKRKYDAGVRTEDLYNDIMNIAL